MITAVLVVLCGGAGAIGRFLLDSLVQSPGGSELPLGTLVVNTSGCLLDGLLVGLHVSHHVTLLLGTALLGSYTTFSTWMLETHRPAQDGEGRVAWLNVVLGIAIGLWAVAVGRMLGRAL